MGIKSTLFAATAAAIVGLPAAAAVVQSSTRILQEDGQNLSFQFDNLDQYVGMGGYFTISTGAATTGAADGSDDGIDLDGEGRLGKFEFMRVAINGEGAGRYSCGGRYKHIGSYTMNGPADCQFSFRLDLGDEDFQYYAENPEGIEILLNFGVGVGAFDDGDEITVAFNMDTPPTSAVPLPASALLLLGGLGAAGFASRRRKNKS